MRFPAASLSLDGSSSTSFVGMRYSSVNHLPRSICLQRALQNGALGFFERGAAGFAQIGHVPDMRSV